MEGLILGRLARVNQSLAVVGLKTLGKPVSRLRADIESVLDDEVQMHKPRKLLSFRCNQEPNQDGGRAENNKF